MPLIYPLSFQGGNILKATYTAGGFSTLASLTPDQSPATFTNDTNNGLHKQFESDANNNIAEFNWAGAATYEIELTSVPTVTVGGSNAGIASFTLSAGIRIYNDATFLPNNLESPDFDVCTFVNGSQTFIASVGDTQRVTITGADPGAFFAPDSVGFAFHCNFVNNQTSVSGNFGFKITKLV